MERVVDVSRRRVVGIPFFDAPAGLVEGGKGEHAVVAAEEGRGQKEPVSRFVGVGVGEGISREVRDDRHGGDGGIGERAAHAGAPAVGAHAVVGEDKNGHAATALHGEPAITGKEAK